jgi:hypothetical protein
MSDKATPMERMLGHQSLAATPEIFALQDEALALIRACGRLP